MNFERKPRITVKKEKYKGYPEKKNKNYSEEDLSIPTDVLGSYTGTPLQDDIPVQDSDDL